MDFIEHHQRTPHGSEKPFGVAQTFRHAWQITIQKLGLGQAPRQHRLADPSRAGQPNDGRLFPGGRKPPLPNGTLNHIIALYV